MFRQKITPKLLYFMLATLLLGATASMARSYPPEISDAQAYVYKKVDGHEMKLWVYSPKQSDQEVPAILFFFGGGWNGGSPEQFIWQSKHLANRGMAGIVVDYRVKSRHGVRAVSCVGDALDALRYVTANAAELGIDTHRIGVGGGSAGGHLAASLGTIHKDDPSAPKAMVLYNPVTILAPIPPGFVKHLRAGELVEMIKARMASRKGDRRARLGVEPVELSPLHHVGVNTPPAIIFHGTNDTTVPYESAVLFKMHLEASQIEVDLKTYKGAGHGFFNREPYLSQSTEQLDAFFVKLGWLK